MQRVGVAGKPNTAAKPDPQQANIFRNTVEDENNPQNVDKNAASDLISINDPASIKASKLMQQRMQMAQAEEAPSVPPAKSGSLAIFQPV